MKPVGLLIAAALVGACSGPSRPAEQAIPPGWSRASLFACCSVAVPPGAAVRPAEDEIDTEVVEIRGAGLSGTVALVDAPGVDRPPDAGKRISAIERAAGREFETIRYVMPADREVRFAFSGRLRGSPPRRYLRGELRCGDADCLDARTMLRSLRVSG